MPQISFASDIHLGFYSSKELPKYNWHPGSSTLLLAGDIMDGIKPNYIDWVLNTSSGRQCLMTIGNHELYGSRRDKAIRELKNGFRGTHVQLLVNESVVIDGIRFAGTDLWTDFALFGNPEIAGRAAERSMNDYRKIKVKDLRRGKATFRKLRAADTRSWNSEARHFIRRTLENSSEPTVLMTHHGPSIQYIPQHLRSDLISAAYASHLDKELNDNEVRPVAIVHGHIHESAEYELEDGTWVFANPAGYHKIDANPEFDSQRAFVVSVSGELKRV